MGDTKDTSKRRQRQLGAFLIVGMTCGMLASLYDIVTKSPRHPSDLFAFALFAVGLGLELTWWKAHQGKLDL